ncbi:MAG: hypothetical protein V7L05_07410 [Nostoc sp.]|uniref:hypothetical protein n=1 Tax=Nostoc sp. TaxID=1180 RepID=UPI002FF573AA
MNLGTPFMNLGTSLIPNAQCPMPNAQCPIPNTKCCPKTRMIKISGKHNSQIFTAKHGQYLGNRFLLPSDFGR